MEARNLAPLPADVDHTVAAALPISGLTAWQGLFDHARLTAGQTVLIHGAAGGVGSIAVQLAREVGARVIGTGRAADRDTVLGLGADAFLDLQADNLEDAGEVDVVFDVIGGEILDRSAALVRAGGTLVTIATPPTVQPKDGRAVFFVVEPDRLRLADLAQRLRDGRLKPHHRGRTAARRSARRVRPRPAHPRQDDHPNHVRLARVGKNMTLDDLEVPASPTCGSFGSGATRPGSPGPPGSRCTSSRHRGPG